MRPPIHVIDLYTNNIGHLLKSSEIMTVKKLIAWEKAV